MKTSRHLDPQATALEIRTNLAAGFRTEGIAPRREQYSPNQPLMLKEGDPLSIMAISSFPLLAAEVLKFVDRSGRLLPYS